MNARMSGRALGWLLAAWICTPVAQACELRFTSGGSSLMYTGPAGTTQAAVSFIATNSGPSPCLDDQGLRPGIVVEGAINPGDQRVVTSSVAPFEWTAVSSTTPGVTCGVHNGLAVRSAVCRAPSIAPGESIQLNGTLSANQVIQPPRCFQAASFGRGQAPTSVEPYSAMQGFDVLRACAGEGGGGGGDRRFILRKDDVVDPVPLGGEVEYRITATAQDAGANRPVIVDTLPAGLTFLGYTAPAGWFCSEGTPQVVTCSTLGNVPAGTVVVIALRARADVIGSLVNTCTGSIPGGSGPPVDDAACNEITTITEPNADLAITKSDSVDPVHARGSYSYTLTVENLGPSAASGITVVDTVPADVLIQSAAGTGWSCSVIGQVVTCTRPTMAVGTASILIQVRAPAEGGVIQNRATVSATTGDSNSANNQALEPTTVQPVIDLDVVKTGPATVRLGQVFDYQLVLSNAGPSTANGIALVDTLPSAVQLVSATGTGWSCVGTTTVNCTRAAGLGAGASAPALTIRVQAIAVGTTTNTCTATSSSGADPNGQPSCTEVVEITPPQADLSFAKTDVTDPVVVGSTLRYVISGVNNGPDSAPSVQVVDTLPAGTVWVAGSGLGWNCSHAAGVVTCLRGATPVGAIPDLNIELLAPSQAGVIQNTCVVEAPGTVDPTPTDEACEEQTTINPQSDLEIIKTDSADPVGATDAYFYTLQVNNLGPSAVTGTVAVVDTLPSNVIYQGFTAPGWSCIALLPEVHCSMEGAAVGPLPAIRIDVLAPMEAGSLSNRATVTSPVQDPDLSNNEDTESTLVAAAAGLSISKIDSADPVAAGSNYSYTLTVTNAGPSTVSQAIVTDTLPAGVQYLGASGMGWICAEAAGTVSCTRATLAVGTSQITVDVRAPSEGGSVLNVANVSSDTPDPEPGDDQDDESTTILPVVDLDVVKTGPSTPIRVGAEFEYRLLLTNAGPSTASQILIIDTLPVEVAYLGFSGTGWTCTLTGNQLQCAYASTVAASANAPELVVRVRALAPGKVVNTCIAQAQVPDQDGQPSCEVQTLVEPPLVDLEVVKTTTTPVVAVGGTLDYTLTVTNLGPDPAPASSVQLVDTLPPGTALLNASGPGWTCTAGIGDVTCLYGPTLPVGASTALSIQARAPTVAGSIENVCVVESIGTTDPTPNDCRVSNEVQDQADLVLIKTDVADPVPAGGALGYVLQVRNDGPSDVAGQVVVSDTLPTGLGSAVASGTGWNCSAAAGQLTCTRMGLALGPAPEIQIQSIAPATAGILLNRARVDGPVGLPDPNPTNNLDEETTQITALSGLAVTKTDSVDPVAAGSIYTYRLTVTNAGPSEVVNARLEDTLPAGLDVIETRGGQWVCAQTDSRVSCTRATVPVGSSTVEIDVRAPMSATVVTNVVTVEADTPDPDTGDNSDTEETTVQAPANLAVRVTDDMDPVQPGQRFRYHVEATNTGTMPLTGVRIEGQGSGVSVQAVGSRSVGLECTGEVCSVGTLGPGAVVRFDVDVAAPGTPQALSYEALGFASEEEIDVADNMDIEPTAMLGPLSPVQIPALRWPGLLVLVLTLAVVGWQQFARRTPH